MKFHNIGITSVRQLKLGKFQWNEEAMFCAVPQQCLDIEAKVAASSGKLNRRI